MVVVGVALAGVVVSGSGSTYGRSPLRGRTRGSLRCQEKQHLVSSKTEELDEEYQKRKRLEALGMVLTSCSWRGSGRFSAAADGRANLLQIDLVINSPTGGILPGGNHGIQSFGVQASGN